MNLKDITDRIDKNGRDKILKAAKKAFDLGWIEHSNTLIAKELTRHAKTLPLGQTKDRLVEIATFVDSHPEMCYPDIHDYFNNVKGWYPDPQLMQEVLNAVKGHKMVARFTRKNLQKLYPDVSEWGDE